LDTPDIADKINHAVPTSALNKKPDLASSALNRKSQIRLEYFRGFSLNLIQQKIISQKQTILNY